MNPFALSGLITTALLHGGVLAALAIFAGAGDDNGQPRLQMVTIEATLAYKSKDQSKQPQKERRQKAPKVEAPGVSRDENKKVEAKKEEPEEDFADDFEKYKNMRQTTEEDEDMEEGEEAPRPGGQFDGSEHGFAEVSKGDPYMQELAGQVYAAWEVPSLEKGGGAAVGCVRLAQDGSIVDTQLWKPAENGNINRSVELALANMKKLRKSAQTPVPRHLLDATHRWTCFNFNVGQQ